MTFDQFTNLLAALAWPAVALIVGSAAVHVARIIAEAIADLRAEVGRWASAYIREVPFAYRSAAAEKAKPTLDHTVHDGIVAILQSQGGIPSAGPNDRFGPALVREIRSAYREIEKPTPAPVPREWESGPGIGSHVTGRVFDDLEPEYAELIDEEEDV
jgi:hypothetical protein